MPCTDCIARFQALHGSRHEVEFQDGSHTHQHVKRQGQAILDQSNTRHIAGFRMDSVCRSLLLAENYSNSSQF